MNVPTKPSDQHKPYLKDRGTINPKDSIARLTLLLGTAKLIQLAELLDDVIERTGYGDVKIVIAEGKVQRLKAEHSYE